MLNIFNSKTLSEDEVLTLKRAERLRSVMSLEGWNDIMSILTDISQRMYPNPKDKKYDLFPWKGIEKDYTYARGGTEVVKEFLSIMTQQEDIFKNLSDKAMKENSDEQRTDDLYETLLGRR